MKANKEAAIVAKWNQCLELQKELDLRIDSTELGYYIRYEEFDTIFTSPDVYGVFAFLKGYKTALDDVRRKQYRAMEIENAK